MSVLGGAMGARVQRLEDIGADAERKSKEEAMGLASSRERVGAIERGGGGRRRWRRRRRRRRRFAEQVGRLIAWQERLCGGGGRRGGGGEEQEARAQALEATLTRRIDGVESRPASLDMDSTRTEGTRRRLRRPQPLPFVLRLLRFCCAEAKLGALAAASRDVDGGEQLAG